MMDWMHIGVVVWCPTNMLSLGAGGMVYRHIPDRSVWLGPSFSSEESWGTVFTIEGQDRSSCVLCPGVKKSIRRLPG